MKKQVLITAPAYSMSGYGSSSRDLLRALRLHEHRFDLYLHATSWGNTGWIYDDNEERQWLDHLVHKLNHRQQVTNEPFDISCQISIPQEFRSDLARMNIGFTAGVETTKISPLWIQHINAMDKIVVPSEFTKKTIVETVYSNGLQTLKVETPVEVIPHLGNPHILTMTKERAEELVDLSHIETKFNFLSVGLLDTKRKNFDQMIRWFAEEMFPEDVGLILKVNRINNSLIDREFTKNKIEALLSHLPREYMQCKVYLLHGDMTEEEMAALHCHPKVNAFCNIASGEGFGLPIFDSMMAGVPVVTTNWSAPTEYLHIQETKIREKANGKKKKIVKNDPYFAPVDYTLDYVQPECHWENVILPDSMWAFPKEESFKKQIRDVLSEPQRFRSLAQRLRAARLDSHAQKDILERLAQAVHAQGEAERAWHDQLSQTEIL